MSSVEQLIPHAQFDQLREAREILKLESNALSEVARRLDSGFCEAVDSLLTCSGSVIVCGMGKAGLIGQKLTATLSSTGTRAHFLHPAEAVHGDLGCIHPQDILLALSNSGETEEISALLPTVKRMGVPIIAITGSERSTLGHHADIRILLGRLQEACPWGLAPTTSTTAMLAVGDALALVVARQRGFSPQQFAVFHPAGSLGRRLKSVTEIMRPLSALRQAQASQSVREVFVSSPVPGRRSGAVLLLDEDGTLAGLFTDSDLARLMEQRRDESLDHPIRDVMTTSPVTLPTTAMFSDVVAILSERKISEIPVVNERGAPVGMIDITDVIGWLPTQ
ncbi:MAG: KpsF/GutQ family sugar-phosphate isomerase [Planctomycetota bacterium]|jgi:arabinose-5-phosphate isomerase|nr:MAG: KpsF/GutQ family sugar-phosphate isomerase [Planctomycetota bacterium]